MSKKYLDTNITHRCVDCGINTYNINEYYMARKEIWQEANLHKGMICIGCLENRLGRFLRKKDFSDCLLNEELASGKWKASNRLFNRITTP